jgi:amino acid transporter
LKYAIVLANNLTAAGLIIQYWRPDLNVRIWVTLFAVVIIAVNILYVGSFEESEFILSAIKIATLVRALLASSNMLSFTVNAAGLLIVA